VVRKLEAGLVTMLPVASDIGCIVLEKRAS
jgi:hypothetical protein